MFKSILYFVLAWGISSRQPRASPTTEQITQSLINKLFRMCQQTETISFLQCQSKMIANDKKNGNFRKDHNYTKQSIYMMHVYDFDKDGRLNKLQLRRIAYDVMNEKISDQKIDRTIRQIEQEQDKIEQEKNKIAQETQQIQQEGVQHYHHEVTQELNKYQEDTKEEIIQQL